MYEYDLSSGVDIMKFVSCEKFGKFWLFILFAVYGIVAIGPLQWYNISISEELRVIIKTGVPLVSLVFALFLRHYSRFREYWKVIFGFFVAGIAFLFQWGVFQFLTFPSTIESIVFEKLTAALLIITPIIVLTKLSGDNLGSIYIKKGKIRSGLIVGIAAFALFTISAVPTTISIFDAKNINSNIILVWAPWILVFVLANAFLEEFMYRALFLKRYEAFFGPKISNLLQAIIFCTIHLSVSYSPEPNLFVILTFILGLAWGYLMQKTNSLLGSVLFHAGTDISIIIQIFSTLGV
ncbi:MAG: type II CAAX endopeptidase family protein [Candidatus Bathyarchaeota archaeon]|nr:type II CAAX endopeptidase family protein [Candidatus Bathyarchaeota archaeon]